MRPLRGAFICLCATVLGRCATITRQPRAVNTPAPMLEPLYPTCEQFHRAGVGETCRSISDALALPLAELAKLNPVLGTDGQHCADKLLSGYFYCVKALPGGSGGEAQPKKPQATGQKTSANQQAGVVVPVWLKGGLLDQAIHPKLRGKKPKPKPKPKAKPKPKPTKKKKPAPSKKPEETQPAKLAPGALLTQDQLDAIPACQQWLGNC